MKRTSREESPRTLEIDLQMSYTYWPNQDISQPKIHIAGKICKALWPLFPPTLRFMKFFPSVLVYARKK